MIDRSHEATNEASRQRLAGLVASLEAADLAKDTGEGWTVAMVLGHVAFWDRWQLARWKTVGEGSVADSVVRQVSGLINDANEGILRAVPAADAGPLALTTTTELDAFIAALPDSMVEVAQAAGRTRMLDRAHHRLDHVSQIERALGRG